MTATKAQDRNGNAWLRAAQFRFYEELNDFLPPDRRKREFDYAFDGTPAVKDVIEAIGVPHTEIDLILVDGKSVGFDHRLEGSERVAVYPMFERLDISPLIRLRPKPLREPKFMLDVHLGKLARYLRLLGFDTAYANDLEDAVIASRARAEKRIVLTRDRGLLKRSEVTHGHWLRNTSPRRQLSEVVAALDLGNLIAPFSRCMNCNGTLEPVAENEVRAQLPPGVRGRYRTITRCRGCARLYWPGSHYARLSELISQLEGERGAAGASEADSAR
jgi:uncharacterized protein with PIN domain